MSHSSEGPPSSAAAVVLVLAAGGGVPGAPIWIALNVCGWPEMKPSSTS